MRNEEDDHFDSNSTDYSDESTEEETEEDTAKVEDSASCTVRMRSNDRFVRGKIKWEISDIRSRIRRTRRFRPFESPIFRVRDAEAKSDYQFQLITYFKGVEDEPQSKDHISIFLLNVTTGDGLVIRYRFYLVGTDGRRHHKSRMYTSYFDTSDSWGELELVPKSLLKQSNTRLLHGDSVVLMCQLEIRFANNYVEGDNANGIEMSTLSSSLYSEMKAGVMTDVIVVCQEQRFPCHKLVLSARSTVFKAMFAHQETRESKEGEAHVADVGPEVIEKMLEFMYLDTVSEVGSLASELFVAADKYNISGLKVSMERIMAKSLSVDNVADVLILLDHHGCSSDLDKTASEFAAHHITDVMKTEGWAVIARSCPTVVDNIVQFPVNFSRGSANNGEEVGAGSAGGIVANLPSGISVRSLELLAKAFSMDS